MNLRLWVESIEEPLYGVNALLLGSWLMFVVLHIDLYIIFCHFHVTILRKLQLSPKKKFCMD